MDLRQRVATALSIPIELVTIDQHGIAVVHETRVIGEQLVGCTWHLTGLMLDGLTNIDVLADTWQARRVEAFGKDIAHG